MRMYANIALVLGMLIAMTAAYAQDDERELTDNLFANPSFEDGFTERGELSVPTGWELYAGGGEPMAMGPTDDAEDGATALIIDDGDPGVEIGITQSVQGEGGIAYEASAMVKALKPSGGAGAYIQLRFSPSGEFVQVDLGLANEAQFTKISAIGVAPEDTTSVRVYFYCHASPTPRFIIDNVSLIGGVEPPPPPPPPPPDPVPPVYDAVKDLHLQTDLVGDGEALATIVSPARYSAQADAIAAAIERITGVRPEVVEDTDEVATVPADDGALERNFILLGNRSTNAMLEELYNRFYTMLDLRYPGEGGSVVRTCHNPFGDGHNLVYVGGSNDAGVSAAADTLIAKLGEAGGAQGALSVGRLAEITLGEGIEFSHDPLEIEMWDASKGYGSTGYFGWVSLSKHLAAYYMSGDEFHAREFLRLAFPDDQAKRDITRVDGERIENKDDPLAGPYHYNSHMMILFWDLVEESPVFSDEERLAVTNAFSRQLTWRAGEGVYRLQQPPSVVGSRHGQYSAISLYCLARYFVKDYGDPVWQQGMLGSHMAFEPLATHAWVNGEADNLFWYNTGHAPILRFMLLSGWRAPLENGVLAKLLRGQEILTTGKLGDWDLRSASITFLHRAAYLTQDGRWLEYLGRTGQDLSVPRVGQSFWPEEHMQPELAMDMVGHWEIHDMPVPMWARRGTGFPLEDSFQFGSFRSAPDETGDYILIDGYNGASRNPYHTFAILEQRLAGQTLLKGYRNQVLTRVDGMVEPTIAMNGALRARDVVGDVVGCVGEVPDAAYCNWRRTLTQRIGQYALVVDELTMRESSENIQVQTLWEVAGGGWDEARNAIAVSGATGAFTPVGWRSILALHNTRTSNPEGSNYLVDLGSIGIALLRATEPGHWMEMQFKLDKPLVGEAYVDFVRYVDRGIVSISLDGEVVKDRLDLWGETADPARVALGRRELAAGDHTLRVEVIENGRGGDRAYIGLQGLSVKPDDADEAPEVELRQEIVSSDPVRAIRQGSVFTLEWTGAADEGQRLTFFSVIGRDITGDEEDLSCLRLADNAAAIGLPQPAIAIAGEYAGTQADLAIIARDHLYAREATALAADQPLLEADEPVTVTWDFEAATLAVLAKNDTQLALRMVAPDGVAVDGTPTQCELAGGMMRLNIPEGQHTITGARPAEGMVADLPGWLGDRQTEAGQIRAQAAEAEAPGALPDVPEIEQTQLAKVDGAVEHTIAIPDGQGGELICAAEAQTIHLMRPDGTEVATATTDGPIRDLHWWPEHELLLAACADEQLIAFDRSGARKWVFVSEMDPAVFRAAKDYWFKTAAAHSGLWGVTSIPSFIDGKTQAVIGSACTLEFVDGDGKLVHRMPQFWGDPHVFQLVDGPDGSVNLLAARRINGGHRVGIINNRTLMPDQRGFNATPAGHTYVGGWSSMNRYHLIHEDLDGDGTREVISEINGSWNRVTAWNEQGAALYDASFGPGTNSPTRNMRDLVVADLDADGTMEVITATSGGLVVCLDHEMNREWARAMPAAPNVMMAVPAGEGARLLVACDEGTVALLDASGEVVRATTVDGRPAWRGMTLVQTADGPLAVLGTSTGAVVTMNVD